MKNLSLISFVGVDSFTSLGDIVNFKEDIHCEWSVLFSDTKSLTKHIRYPEYSFCKDFLKLSKSESFLASLHLCGSVIDRYLKQEQDVMDLCQLASRIQLNLNISEYPDCDKLSDDILSNIHKYGHQVILQKNKTKEKFMNIFLKKSDTKINILHDGSGGFGREIECIIPPEDNIHFTGYAGGIKPENVLNIVNLINNNNPYNKEYYIDMESGIRENNIFSINKCRQVIDNLIKA